MVFDLGMGGTPVVSVVVGLLTAVVSVFLTFYLYRKRDEIIALRAIKQEARHNQEIAKEIIEYISQDLQLDEADQERLDAVETFHTSAFENIKNSGVLARLPEHEQKQITSHYNRISWVNRQIIYREQLRGGAGRAMGGYSDRRRSLNSLIQTMIRTLSKEDFSIETEDIESSMPTVREDQSTVTFHEIMDVTETGLDRHLLSRIL